MKGVVIMEHKKQIILYGLGGPDIQYVALGYFCIYEEDISIENIMRTAQIMRMKNPTVESVYAIDNRPGLKKDYLISIKKHTIESCAIFKDLLERYGLKVI